MKSDKPTSAFDGKTYTIVHGNPLIDWPQHWTWKDKVVSDNAVHPLAREAVYRSLHKTCLEGHDSKRKKSSPYGQS